MSQVLSSASRAGSLDRHIPEMPARHSGVTARTDTRRDDPFQHCQQAPAKYSAPQELPTIFVVDDDVSVRESLELLIGFEGWRPQTFASAQEFLDRLPAVGPRLSRARCDATRPQRPGTSRTCGRRASRSADHLYYRSWRHPDDGQGHEGGSC